MKAIKLQSQVGLRINIANDGNMPQWVIIKGNGVINNIDNTVFEFLKKDRVFKDLLDNGIISDETIQTILSTTPDNLTLIVGNSSDINIKTNAESFTAESDNKDIVVTRKSKNKVSINAKKAGSCNVIVTANEKQILIPIEVNDQKQEP